MGAGGGRAAAAAAPFYSTLRLPGYAVGTENARAGWRLVGERGPELERSAGGERIETASRTEQMLDALSTNRSPTPIIMHGGSRGSAGGNITVIDRRTNGDPPPKIDRKSNGDTTISLEKMFDKRSAGTLVRCVTPPWARRRR